MRLALIFSHLLGALLLSSFFPGELRAEDEEDKPRKLCGREFSREAIIACGKPHWGKKRLQPKQVLPYRSSEVENGQLESEEGRVRRLIQGSDLLKNSLSLGADTEGSMIDSEESMETVEKNKNEIKAISPSQQYDFMLGTHPRKKREEFSLSKYCCEQGCTMYDLMSRC